MKTSSPSVNILSFAAQISRMAIARAADVPGKPDLARFQVLICAACATTLKSVN
jgi:hypothetical protein